MKRFITLNSTYEVEGPCLRRTEGTGPSALPVPDGEWLEAEGIIEARLGVTCRVLAASFPGGLSFVSSAIVEVEETLPEPEEEEDPEPCSFETRRATYIDPPEFCEEDAAPGSDFCPAHDPDREDDARIARAEDAREWAGLR